MYAEDFDFGSNCFFYGKTSVDGRQETHEVKSEETGKNLTGVNARYHVKCMTNFYTETSHTSPDRPVSQDITDFIFYCINFIEDSAHECKFSSNEIKTKFTGKIPDVKVIKKIE